MPQRRARETQAPNNSGGGGGGGTFEAFLEGWLVRQEHYLDELLSADQTCHDALRDLVSRILGHYQQYYHEKSRAAARNVFVVFSPPWFTPFEKTFLWIAGFKPGLVFGILASSVTDLSEEQNRRLSLLRVDNKVGEKVLSDQLAKIQENMAAPPMVDLARRWGRLVDGEIGDADRVLERLKEAMEAVLTRADSLRMDIAERAVAILTPVQGVRFLTAATQLQLKLRVMGTETRSNNHW